MTTRWSRTFVLSAAWIFGLTGIAKLVSAVVGDVGDSEIFSHREPLLGISFRLLFFIVGLAELCVACCCVFGNDVQNKLLVIAFFAGSLVIYRAGLWYLDYHSPCSCLGSLTGHLHINPVLADAVLKILLGYLLVGSGLLWAFGKNHSKETVSFAGR